MTDPQDPKDTDYVLPSSDEEARRLELQAGLYGGTEFLDKFLEKYPGAILDAGSGTGFFARHVAACLPDARVVGLDMDESRLSFARSRSDAANLTFQQGDLAKLPFDDQSFDLVYSRFVLVHYPDPVEVLREMARVTKAGGRVVAYDMIHDGIWFSPPRPAFDRLMKQVLAIMRQRGLEPDQGLHLPVAMRRAGFKDVQAQVIPHTAVGPGPGWEIYRQNWLETVSSLSKSLLGNLEQTLFDEAQTDLKRQEDQEFLVEITVLTHGLRKL